MCLESDLMKKLNVVKISWIGFITVIFILFSAWYGGNGKPITSEQGAEYLKRLQTAYANLPPEEAIFVENMRNMIAKDDGKEFYAVNLEKLKQGQEAQDADRAYVAVVFPQLLKRAGHPVFAGPPIGLSLGEYGNTIDRVAVVRYRSLKDMIEMTLEPAFIEGSDYKFASLEHTEVFLAKPQISFMHVRIIVALFLIVVGLSGLKLINFFGTGSKR